MSMLHYFAYSLFALNVYRIEAQNSTNHMQLNHTEHRNRGIVDNPIGFLEQLLTPNETILEKIKEANTTDPADLIYKAEVLSKYLQSHLYDRLNLDPLSQYFLVGKSFILTRGVVCRPAELIISYLMNQIREFKASEREIKENCMEICRHILVTPGVTNEIVCTGFVERILPHLYYVIKMKPDVSSLSFVSIVLQQAGCASSEKLEWSVQIPPEIESPLISTDLEHSEDPSFFTEIVHLTDLHIDPLFQPGANAECLERFLCCRRDMRTQNKSLKAGYFSDPRKCGTPWWTLNKTLKQIANNHPKVKLIYLTGDVGIHDTHPVYTFPPGSMQMDNLTTAWLYEDLFENLNQWIPGNQMDSFYLGGFYALQAHQKLKVISINTNFCHGYNLWVLYAYKDASSQLRWLANQLKLSEEAGQFVHIIGHVPPGHQACDREWSKNYYKILVRFKKTIRGQFFGYTHMDEFKVYYDPVGQGEPISTLFIGGSLTSYKKYNFNNPGYKIYFADGERKSESNWRVHDYESWIFDLVEANKIPRFDPKWFKLYSAREAYNLTNLSPKSLDSLVQRFSKNRTLFNLYYQYSHKMNKMNKTDFEGCDIFCYKITLCSIVIPYIGELETCKRIQNKIDGVELSSDPTFLENTQKRKDLRPIDAPFYDEFYMPIDYLVKKPSYSKKRFTSIVT